MRHDSHIFEGGVSILGLLFGVLMLFILSGFIAILSSAVLLTLAIHAAYIVKQYYDNRLHNTVQDVLGFFP